MLLAAVVLLGLTLRVAAAQGGLWLDEAWSAELAHQARTPLGVFLNINHDNNHHLNSLWLLLVGYDAAPVLQRGLSIATGTTAIVVAAAIFAQRSKGMALVAALLFAVSPMVVTMGSEARGYAPMSLALLVAVLLVSHWLSDAPLDRTRQRLALCFALGALSQLTMVFGCVALIGWAFLSEGARTSPVTAAKLTFGLFAPALIALLAVLAVIAGAALASPTGFQFGSYAPFTVLLFLHAQIEMVGYTIGWPIVSLWLLPIVLVVVLLAHRGGARLTPFYWLAIVAFPLALAILHAGNVGHPRYYLLAAIALLLLLAETTATLIARGGWQRIASAGAIVAILGGGLWQDAALIRNQRGDPTKAITALAARAPGGTTVLLDRSTGLAMLRVAAAHAHYPLMVVEAGCPAAPFLFVDRFKGETFDDPPPRCRGAYRPIASAYAVGLSGTHWALYERAPAPNGATPPPSQKPAAR